MTRAYGLLLCLYPESYRKTFAAEMTTVFEKSAREQRRLGWAAFLRFLIIEAAGLVKGSAIQWISALSRTGEHPGDLAPAGDSSLPDEIVQAQRRIQYNLHGMEDAIAHHQFERARLFSAADQKERENLRSLWLSHGLPGEPRTET
jgi:hypothetical protein